MTYRYTNTIHDALVALEVFACDGATDDLEALRREAQERVDECDADRQHTLARLFAIVEGAAGSYRLAIDYRLAGNVQWAMILEADAGRSEALVRELLLS
jgi:hypothetical protein